MALLCLHTQLALPPEGAPLLQPAERLPWQQLHPRHLPQGLQSPRQQALRCQARPVLLLRCQQAAPAALRRCRLLATGLAERLHLQGVLAASQTACMHAAQL